MAFCGWSFGKYFCALLAAGFSLGSVLIVQARILVNLEVSNNAVEAGDSMTATCSVRSNDPKPQYFMRWVRRDCRNKEVDIATNLILEEQFIRTGRYNVSLKMLDASTSSAEFKLTIKGIKTWETGVYGCIIPTSRVRVFKEVTPVSNVNKIILQTTTSSGIPRNLTQGQPLLLKYGSLQTIKCVAIGGYPKPKLSMYIKRKNKEEPVKLINEQSAQHSGCVSDPGGRYVPKKNYSVIVEAKAIKMGPSLDGMTIGCVATLSRMSDIMKDTSTSVILKMPTFVPQFGCSKEKIVSTGDTNVTISCPVVAKPPVSDGRFLWQSADGKSETLIPIISDSTRKEYNASIVPGNSSLQVNMVLTIYQVQSKHLRTYIFQAFNQMGEQSFTITLREKSAVSHGHVITGGMYLQVALLSFPSIWLFIHN